MRGLPALAKTVFTGFIVSLLLGLVAAFGTRFGLWNLAFGLDGLLPWSVGIAALTFVFGIVWMLWAVIANDSNGARYGLIGFAGSILVLYNPVGSYIDSYGTPPIHDVSTDTEHAPPFVSLLTLREDATNSPVYDGEKKIMFRDKLSTVSALQHKYEAGVRPAPQLATPARVFRRALNTVYDMHWTVVAIVPDQGRIEATDTTFFFGLTDDIVIRVRTAGAGAKVDIRSESRVGESDGGRNARRIVAFLKQLIKESN